MLEFGVRFLEMLVIAVGESVIFANSLVGATMQDGGKREKSDAILNTTSVYSNLVEKC